jgi:hypothetical protein
MSSFMFLDRERTRSTLAPNEPIITTRTVQSASTQGIDSMCNINCFRPIDRELVFLGMIIATDDQIYYYIVRVKKDGFDEVQSY